MIIIYNIVYVILSRCCKHLLVVVYKFLSSNDVTLHVYTAEGYYILLHNRRIIVC